MPSISYYLENDLEMTDLNPAPYLDYTVDDTKHPFYCPPVACEYHGWPDFCTNSHNVLSWPVDLMINDSN
jgi:hypothetical protein